MDTFGAKMASDERLCPRTLPCIHSHPSGNCAMDIYERRLILVSDNINMILEYLANFPTSYRRIKLWFCERGDPFLQ